MKTSSQQEHEVEQHVHHLSLTRVNSTNVQDEGLRIGGIGRGMNSKVNVSQTRCVLRVNMAMNLA
jgi:hypothetical protein